jgi:hypothetical protein
MFNNSTLFIGIDLGDKHSFVTILDPEGELVEETRLPTTRTAFQRKFSSIPACRIAMEVGTHSRWVSHLLKELRHDVLVALLSLPELDCLLVLRIASPIKLIQIFLNFSTQPCYPSSVPLLQPPNKSAPVTARSRISVKSIILKPYPCSVSAVWVH